MTEAKKKNIQKYKKRFPEKTRAYIKAHDIPLPDKELTRHHWSYKVEHRRDIIFINRIKHDNVHRHITYDQNTMMYRTPTGELLDTKEKHLGYIIKFIND